MSYNLEYVDFGSEAVKKLTEEQKFVMGNSSQVPESVVFLPDETSKEKRTCEMDYLKSNPYLR